MKIAVGLSGGVDSAVSAAFLVEQGHEVTGIFLECWSEPGCRTDQDRQDALGVALKLKIPFKVLDFKKEYQEKVLKWFYREYKAGRTPNPDVICNREIKFGLFLEWSLKNGFEKVATGHYAQLSKIVHFSSQKTTGLLAGASNLLRTRPAESPLATPAQQGSVSLSGKNVNYFQLFQSTDKKKDQTYFLALLKQKQLEKVMFPIGNLTKKQVRLEAKKRGFKIWNKKDSTGICLVGHDYSFEEFLKRKIKEHEGEVVNKKGEVVGRHKGVEFYTIGQRHNFEITEKSTSRPRYFVIKKDIKSNRLVVGSKKDLGRKEFEVESWSWISNPRRSRAAGLRVRIRHQGRLTGCKVNGKKVILEKVEYGIAPGQVAVIYKTEGTEPSECLGGGVIKN